MSSRLPFFGDPGAAAREVVDVAKAAGSLQDGRIDIELNNAPLLYKVLGVPAKYKAGH